MDSVADNGVDSGNVVQCNNEALSDLCILDPSQMVIPFNTMATLCFCSQLSTYYRILLLL